MSNFVLLEEDILYKEQVTTSAGYWVGSIYYEGTVTKTYTEFEGFWEPYRKGEESVALPEGVRSSDAISVWSETPLKTYNDLIGNASVADKIKLSDVEGSPVYVVYDAATWSKNRGFQLLLGHQEFLAIREEKLP